MSLRGWWRNRRDLKHELPWAPDWLARNKVGQQSARTRLKARREQSREGARRSVESCDWAASDHQTEIRQRLPFDRPVLTRRPPA